MALCLNQDQQDNKQIPRSYFTQVEICEGVGSELDARAEDVWIARACLLSVMRCSEERELRVENTPGGREVMRLSQREQELEASLQRER